MAYTTVNDSSAYFQTTLYTGNGSTQSITNGGNSDLKPDLAWIKDRGSAFDHKLSDSNRGSTYTLETNETTAAYNDTNAVTSFNTDGFSLGSNGNVNDNTANVVAWQWKANGGTTSSNGSGSITSTVQANTTAGFSIVTWTGTTSNGTVGHGLGKAPDCIFFKNYAASENWTTYHSKLGNTGGLYLNLTNGFNSAGSWYNDTSPTSSVFSVGTNTKTNGGTMVAYCFANIKGYSSFGSYTGNAAEPAGPFIYTGFAPAFIMVKASSEAGQNWVIGDRARDPYNIAIRKLFANTNGSSSAAVGDNNWDFLSNGFQIRTSDDAMNKSGVTFQYLAFAEMPLVATNNVLALAR